MNYSELLEPTSKAKPIFDAIEKKGIDFVVDKLTKLQEPVYIRKGINQIEFERLLPKLIKYNENSKHEYRVCITQNLFLDIIGGNVTELSKLYREHQKEINNHNEKYKLTPIVNRRLIIKLKPFYNKLSEWLKEKIK